MLPRLLVLMFCGKQVILSDQPNENYELLKKIATHDNLVLRPNEGLVYLENRPFTGTGINQVDRLEAANTWWVKKKDYTRSGMNLAMGKAKGMQQAWRENDEIYNNYEAKKGRIFGLKKANLCYELDNEITQFEAQ